MNFSMILTFISIVFFFSGISGLIYQIVWTRMLLLNFGSTTHTITAVVSAFMTGLAIGSFLGPKIFKKLTNYFLLYAAIEFVIGISALLTPFFFEKATSIYTSFYAVYPFPILLLITKFFLITLALLPATIAMGMTLPILVHYITQKFRVSVGKTVSILYAVNTFGAFVGTLLSAYVLIEVFGLRSSLYIACSINFILSIVVFAMSKKQYVLPKEDQEPASSESTYTSLYTKASIRFALVIFSLSGLVSMAYEILWIRMLTPISGTYIYAFSSILALFFMGIIIGSLIAYFVKTRYLLSSFGFAQIGIGIGAISSVVIASSRFQLSTWAIEALIILPATICMGLTFPFISRFARVSGAGSFVGTSYAVNTIGSLVGPYIASFLLLPFFGTTRSIMLLGFVNIIFGIILFQKESIQKGKAIRSIVTSGMLIVCVTGLLFLILQPQVFYERSVSQILQKVTGGSYKYIYKEDETASVIAWSNEDGSDHGLLVDGVGMSSLVNETKLMAHIPILLHPDPSNMLIIAFGLGTTHRSALSYDIDVDSVELVPSVPKAFPLFFSDASSLLTNPKGNIIINDGRNYVRMSKKKYDIIAIDPPPPVNSAGTTVLYSKEFYEQSKKLLTENGMVSQWLFYGTRIDDFRMLVKSFIDVFPYVQVFLSPQDIGIYVIGSVKPMSVDKTTIEQKLSKYTKANNDINEWSKWDSDRIVKLYAGDKGMLERFAKGASAVTDDHPRTEYFLLRQTFTTVDAMSTYSLLYPDTK